MGRIKRVLPYFLVMILVLAAMTQHYEYSTDGTVDITRTDQEVSRKDYFLTELNVLRTYIRLLFVPVRQNLDYDYPVSSRLDMPTILSLLLHISILGLGLFFLKREPNLSAM